MTNSIKYSIPEYLLSFLSEGYGKSMIIKGNPGSGKTTFALQILENFTDVRNPILLSTRIGDESLYSQFPWLKEYEKKIKILFSSEIFLSEINKENKKTEKSAAKLLLSEINEKQYVSKFFYYHILKDQNSPEILKIYSEIESNLPKKSLVVIDSLEGLSNTLKIPESFIVYMLQKDLVETSQSDVVYISEKNKTSPEDFIVDALIIIESVPEEKRTYRRLTLNKLRGKSTAFPVYPFTLSNGHVHVFSSLEKNINIFNKFEIVPFKEGYFSSGIKELDNKIGGGFMIGSLVNIEVDRDVSLESLRFIRNQLFINTIIQGKGINHTPAPGSSYIDVKNLMLNYVSENDFYRNYINIDYTTFKPYGKNHFTLAGLDMDKAYQIDKKETEEFSKRKNLTISWVHYDVLEHFFGSDRVMKILFDMLSLKRQLNANTIALTKPGQKINNEITNIADYKFKIISKDNVIFLYGIKPFTLFYAIEIDEEKGFPNIKLTPVT